jgi:predicted negative regulator of RcsB-dependent stress response
MATSTASRSRRPNPTLDSEDALSLRAAELAAWARRNARVIIAVASVVLLVAVGMVAYRVNASQRSARAAERLLALRHNPVTTTAAGTRELEAFIQQYRGTREGEEARLLLAEARLAAGQPREAAAALEPVAAGRSPLRVQATMLMAAAQAQAGDLPAAIRSFERAAGSSRTGYERLEALIQAAVLAEEAGDHAAAADLYRRVLGEVEEDSPVHTVIRMHLAEASARAEPAPPQP